MNHFQFKLPDLGEGLTEAKIQCWHVEENDDVTQDQLLVTVETDKTLVDIPVLQKGNITKIHFPNHSKVSVGQVLCTIRCESLTPIVGEVPKPSPTITLPRKKTYKIHPKALALAKSHNINEATLTKLGQNQKMIMTSDILEYVQPSNSPMAKISANSTHRATSSIIDHAPISTTHALTARIVNALHHSLVTSSILSSNRICIAVDDQQQTLLISPPTTADLEDTKSLISQIKSMCVNNKFPHDWLKPSEILLSNFGTISGRYGFPLLPSGVKIAFGIGEAFTENEQLTLPITIVFDHSHFTGGQIARVLKTCKSHLAKS